MLNVLNLNSLFATQFAYRGHILCKTYDLYARKLLACLYCIFHNIQCILKFLLLHMTFKPSIFYLFTKYCKSTSNTKGLVLYTDKLPSYTKNIVYTEPTIPYLKINSFMQYDPKSHIEVFVANPIRVDVIDTIMYEPTAPVYNLLRQYIEYTELVKVHYTHQSNIDMLKRMVNARYAFVFYNREAK